MNKITYFVIALILMLSSASALEKKDCSGLKKISKAYLACKSGNLKEGIKKNKITKSGTKVTKGIFNKAKNFGKKIKNPFKRKN